MPTRTLAVMLALIPYRPNLREPMSQFGLRNATVLIPTKEPHHVVISMMGDALANPGIRIA